MNEQLFSGLTTGAAIGGNILSTILANKANLKLADRSFDFQRQMINEQNAYNSPIQQMARYQEAGLNPNLIYGNIDSGNQSGIAKYEAPTMQAPQVGNVPAMIADGVRAAMANEAIKADLDIKHQQFENLKEQQFAIRAERHARDIDNMYNAAITGFDPGLLSFRQERDQVMSGYRMSRYKQELKSVEALTEQRNASVAYTKVMKQVAGLNEKEKQFFIDNIQPLMKDIMEKRNKGLDISNDLLILQKKFFTADKFVNYGQALVNSIIGFIKPFGGSFSSPGTSNRSTLGSYTYDSYDLPGF